MQSLKQPNSKIKLMSKADFIYSVLFSPPLPGLFQQVLIGYAGIKAFKYTNMPSSVLTMSCPKPCLPMILCMCFACKLD